MDSQEETDYSSFEYQTAVTSLSIREADDSTGDGNARSKAVFSFEPLAGVGGLDNNEVAELVYLEVNAQLEWEDESADQDVGTTAEMRGTVGINLPNSEDAFAQAGPDRGTTEVIDVNNVSENNVGGSIKTKSEDRFLQLYHVAGGPPFDDQTNGPGGSGDTDQFYAEKSYRDMTGRGPVLDANDDMGVATTLVAGDTVLNFSGNVRLHMVWDIAETDDSGRRFSLPS